MNRERAEEYTQSLGQIVAGSWRQIALAHDLGVPQALGMELGEWVEKRLGGYIRQSVPERRQAVLQMQRDDSRSMQEIGAILGVDKSTVWRDVANATKARDQFVNELANRIIALVEGDKSLKQLLHFRNRYPHAIKQYRWTAFEKQFTLASDRASTVLKAEMDSLKDGSANTLSPEVTAAVVEFCVVIHETLDTHVPEKRSDVEELDPLQVLGIQGPPSPPSPACIRADTCSRC
jgi:hypothetical protein